ncbi:MmcQ/YjbR family DNA-binding protein [Ornithinimicrobium cryptoxanthini]|uniref:MmcQ/YjbR family DNA-binding protein n=1 Tax=Ornithinimicrobium cryptoxanthini TaxID=2934161 RepID=A0ABY4YEU7_9MICO|nr:MmcQ/YjbR family DNA-binding protein [Ornithinimicrobium cryptoxanthini]USQ74780.1 MmcQ/YjbR family DNA-binding protein [Ornithinimicrobium cryptoxanthini]
MRVETTRHTVGGLVQTAGVVQRPEVSQDWIRRLDIVFESLPESYRERAWVGHRWRVGQATIAHVFGGEDQQFRIVFRAELAEVMAFEHLGPRYFRAGWGDNVVGIILEESSDWAELAEMLTESYCLQAPARLADLAGLEKSTTTP